MQILNVFKFEDYKELVKAWIQAQPKGGHGQYRRMAGEICLSTVLISQIFNGERDISSDHAFRLSGFMSLSELESRFFLLLVDRARSGDARHKEFLSKQIEAVRKEATSLKKILTQEKELSEAQQARFHSNWSYSAVRLLSSIEGHANVEVIAAALGLPVSEVRKVVTFLVENGLMISEGGHLAMGPQRTHLEKDSPFILSRQKTWRVKGFEKMDLRGEDDFFYTGPMSTSRKLAHELQQELRAFIKSMSDRVVKDTPEKLFCFNIDFFKVSN